MNAMNAPRDGYTWTAGAPKQLGTYPVLGLAGTKLERLPPVRLGDAGADRQRQPNSPYQNFQQLLDDMKAKPGRSRRHRGNTSSGHIAWRPSPRRPASSTAT
jgi:tripartite-type tricarboxylate transporter receptor subunit TctC